MSTGRNAVAYCESTADPIFLFQQHRARKCDGTDSSGRQCDEDKHWFTRHVWYSREEARAFGVATAYNFPTGWRVYCTSAKGQLADLLNAQDNSKPWQEARA